MMMSAKIILMTMMSTAQEINFFLISSEEDCFLLKWSSSFTFIKINQANKNNEKFKMNYAVWSDISSWSSASEGSLPPGFNTSPPIKTALFKKIWTHSQAGLTTWIKSSWNRILSYDWRPRYHSDSICQHSVGQLSFNSFCPHCLLSHIAMWLNALTGMNCVQLR